MPKHDGQKFRFLPWFCLTFAFAGINLYLKEIDMASSVEPPYTVGRRYMSAPERFSTAKQLP
ncbi:MAG: hypothetical protein D6B26_04775 [Spirochaetaceae bacterium]|nr:MAG: hypothetical protein D6B26_04775 [Spirochaetaceae bacterium]